MIDRNLELVARCVRADREREAAQARALAALRPRRHLRATAASGLARLALALNHEAASAAVVQPTLETHPGHARG